MSIRKTLGGDRLGSGQKQKVELKGYERSTHDLSYLWRSTMSSGTLVPYMKQIGLPGDTWDITLNADVKTHPTAGPLFGSYKVQLDTFITPFRLYQAQLHNNKLKIGLDMSQIKLPIITLTALPAPTTANADFDNYQVNPSCILSYLGIRGIGTVRPTDTTGIERRFNAIGILAYWDIYKNYYANKQEEVGAVIHTINTSINETVTNVQVAFGSGLGTVNGSAPVPLQNGSQWFISYTGATPDVSDIIIIMGDGREIPLFDLIADGPIDSGTDLTAQYNYADYGDQTAVDWRYRTATDITQSQPTVITFPLDNIDLMREAILRTVSGNPFDINGAISGPDPVTPYRYLSESTADIPNILSSQEGLGLKTYQSDLFNNWLETEWIDGTTGVNEVTKIDVTSGFLKIDQINLAKKVYDVLNRVAVSGGTYKDWLDVSFDHVVPWIPESPAYMGGLSKELVFQEVVSNSASDQQVLGTLAGKGVMSNKHKGGNVTIKVDEPSMIMGIVSLTPRIDYSQGNDWDVYSLETMNDIHLPGLDEIGFQELIQEQMYWGTTHWDGTKWVQQSAGKQPAWINYMTNVNKVAGNFAIQNNEMFMTLNRRYRPDETDPKTLLDLTTYIDPVKYNQIFAETALDAQNFWVQISVNIECRRKMSARVMPNM